MYCVAHSLAADELVWVGLAVHDVVRAPCGLHPVHALLKGHTAIKCCLVVLGVTACWDDAFAELLVPANVLSVCIYLVSPGISMFQRVCVSICTVVCIHMYRCMYPIHASRCVLDDVATHIMCA